MFVVGLPSLKTNYFGEKEKNAFQRIEPPPAEVVADVARTVLLQMIPSIIEEDIEGFGEAMTAMDTKFGSYWIKIQGGIYSHPRIEEAVNFLNENGAVGVGQSSWGPALYGLVQGETQASKLSERLDRFLKERGGGKAFVTTANNTGAQLETN
jgi:beta-RFAP synthase